MCGICGIYNGHDREPVSSALIERMVGLIAHRGPDERGTYVRGSVGLGVARLSIVDREGGHQPLANETGDIRLALNGEIWNYRQLRQELTAAGHRFVSESDSETVVHAYEEHGVEAFRRLHGMFAIAIWDARQQRIVLARDRMGKKPLYYTRAGGALVFGSEIKALLAHPHVRREVDAQAMVDYLSIRYVPAPATMFAGIAKIRPGHVILYERETLREERYWDYTFRPERRPVEEDLEAIRSHVRRAVEERLMGDVPIGAMLSGGVDSSIVAGTMSALRGGKVKTFAVGFDQPGYDELPYARLAADHFGTDHHELVVRACDLARYWPILTWYRDEPVSEPSDLGVYLLSREARQHVTVVLSGEGGDEVFAGYPKYVLDWMAKYYRLLPAVVRRRAIAPWLERLPYSARKLQLAAGALSEPAPQRWVQWHGVFNASAKEALLADPVKVSVDMDASRHFRWWLDRNPQPDDLSSMLYLDTRMWLPDNVLMKGDKMTMAASLEQRMPLLDRRLVEYAATIPSARKIAGLRPKYLLKRAFADLLPASILRRPKMGYNVPTGIWFRQDLRDVIAGLLCSNRTAGRGYLDRNVLEGLVGRHLAGRTNYQAQLFTLASLELWFRVFIDRSDLAVPDGPVEQWLDGGEKAG
jgi:asparagine synthase (glutamine-hydrolysing)